MLTLTGIAVGWSSSILVPDMPGPIRRRTLIGAPVPLRPCRRVDYRADYRSGGRRQSGARTSDHGGDIWPGGFSWFTHFPRVGALDWTILASAGTIGALFGTPVAAALILSDAQRQ
jgi:hypothetical protein